MKSPVSETEADKTDEESEKPLSEEDRMKYMLGYTVATATSLFAREQFCPGCGTEHPNPQLLDIYGTCFACHAQLREPYHLRKRYQDIKPVDILEILFATFGDPVYPLYAVEVTDQCRARVQNYADRDRLAFRPHQLITSLLNCEDPAPGKSKQLRIRYRMLGVFGTLVLDTPPTTPSFPSVIMMLAPKERFLTLTRAT